jgi:hypothetical protein
MSSRRTDVGAAIGEINLLRGGQALEDARSSDQQDQQPAVATLPEPTTNGNGASNGAIAAIDRRPARRSARRRRDGETVRAEIRVPEEVLNRARSLVRPRRTGAERSLGAGFVLQAFVRAVDDIVLDLDVSGMELGLEDEMVERVKQALAAALQPSTESA